MYTIQHSFMAYGIVHRIMLIWTVLRLVYTLMYKSTSTCTSVHKMYKSVHSHVQKCTFTCTKVYIHMYKCVQCTFTCTSLHPHVKVYRYTSTCNGVHCTSSCTSVQHCNELFSTLSSSTNCCSVQLTV